MGKQLNVKSARELYDDLARLLCDVDVKRFWRIWRAYQADQQRSKKRGTRKNESASRATAILTQHK